MAYKKTILISGAASGIGRQTALLFASRGWQVAAADVNAAALNSLVAELGGSVIPIVGDVRTRAGAQAIMQAATAPSGGKLDCLFNCAGLLEMGPHVEIPTDRVDRLIDVNIKGVTYCIDAAFSALAATPGAHIVNMSSTSAEYGTPDHAMYSASKFFVRGLRSPTPFCSSRPTRPATSPAPICWSMVAIPPASRTSPPEPPPSNRYRAPLAGDGRSAGWYLALSRAAN